MSLHPSVIQYEKKQLCYEPTYGWGWLCRDRTDPNTYLDYDVIEQAGVFHIRVDRFFYVQKDASAPKELRGIVGRVEQPEHMFYGLWVSTWTMTVGTYDFTEKLCYRWDIELGLTEPQVEKGGWLQFPKASLLCAGSGILGASQEEIEQFINKRKHT